MMSQVVVAVLFMIGGCMAADVTNIALGKQASSSSRYKYLKLDLITSPDLAVDGNKDGDFLGGRSCFSTDLDDENPYWMVDLGGYYDIETVTITNRADCCPERLHQLSIYVYDNNPLFNKEEPRWCGGVTDIVPIAADVTITCPRTITGRFVQIKKTTVLKRDDLLTMCEVQVMGRYYGKTAQSADFMVEVGNIFGRQ